VIAQRLFQPRAEEEARREALRLPGAATESERS
jgi:hypothetical protein